jgi:hypothetical protein
MQPEVFVLSHFLDANRYPLRLKMLYPLNDRARFDRPRNRAMRFTVLGAAPLF